MKKHLFKWIAFLLAIILTVPLLPADTAFVSAAAKPAMSVDSKTVIGINQEFKLSIKNLPKTGIKSASWSSTNKKVATVNGGEVTSVGRGTATIKCKITYKSGKVITPACKVTVKIPATAIKISNAQDDVANNSRQVIAVGDTYDFNSALTPANADNSITYAISNNEIATVDSNGIVKGVKPGFVTLTARAKLAKPKDYKNNLDNILDIKDSINLEIVTKTAKVTSVELLDTTTIKVTFDEAIDEKTVLGADKKLLSNISIVTKSDKNGVIASSLGTLTGSLSSDGKILTISTSGYFNGLYGIRFSYNILTKKDSQPLMDYYKELSLYDTEAPSYKNYTIDDTGLIANIHFSEAMNFSGLKVVDVAQVSGTATAKSSTISRLSQKANYKASDDSKSLSIDLTQISTLDRDKQFRVVFSGLKDRAGNYPANDRITAFLATDTKPKAQARVVSIVRTDGNTLTATFSRAIQTPGNILLSNGMSINGIVNDKNTYQVTYTLDSSSAKLTGMQDVQIGYWDSFNVNTSDSSANTYVTMKVNFTYITELPELIDYQFTVDNYNGEAVYNLLLFYNKEVTLLERSGEFKARLVSSGKSSSDNYIGYTANADGTIVTVVLDKGDMNEAGTYTITIPEDFIQDEYGNTNIDTAVKLVNADGSSTALPRPRAVVQSSDDASVIFVTFGNKLDEDSAQNAGNYNVSGAVVESAELTDNTTTGATVKLKLMADSVNESTRYSITISGISGYHNSYTVMEPYTTFVYLRENAGPGKGNAVYTSPDKIIITFNETILGTASFTVMQNGVDLVDSCIISGKRIIITLDDKPVANQPMEIIPTSSNRITDAFGNLSDIGTYNITPAN